MGNANNHQTLSKTVDVKKIIITGAGRTGTTLLAGLLSSSPNILVTNELGIFDYNLNHYYKRDIWFDDRLNKEVLNRKGLTKKDIDDFYTGNFKNKGGLEFFGDKFPTYCSDLLYCSHLVKNHSDAYFIFTYRNPCSTIYSGFHRSNLQFCEFHRSNNKDIQNADWFFNNLEDSIKRFEKFVSNWSKHIFPHVKNKIIIDYDYYINNVDLLVNDLNKFLNTNLDLSEIEKIPSYSQKCDVGFEESRKPYVNFGIEKYKEAFSEEEINFILDKTKELDQYVRSLISQQKKYEI